MEVGREDVVLLELGEILGKADGINEGLSEVVGFQG